jgi:2',3'-cyclic-nucleotide 2'-phosphodiesterase (5'-nucleotidase family)
MTRLILALVATLLCGLLLGVFAGCKTAATATATTTAKTPAGGAGKNPAFSPAPATAMLHLVYVGDTEAGLVGNDDGVGGVARTAAIISALKRRAGSALVVHAGDTFIPAPELSLELVWPPDAATRQSPLLAGNNALGLHAAVLGNHDFDLGESFLADVIKRSTFPYVASTLSVVGGPLAPLVDDQLTWLESPQARGRILRRARFCMGTLTNNLCDGDVVGVVGAVPESLRVLSAGARTAQAPMNTSATIRALKPHIDALRAAGARIIVLLSHRQGVSRDIELVEAGLVGVDVIVSGGGENRLANPGHRMLPGLPIDPLCTAEPAGCSPVWRTAQDGAVVAIVATDGGMRTVGALDLPFDARGQATGIESSSRPHPVDEVTLLELRADVDRSLVVLELATKDALAPLSEVVGTVGVYLEGRREMVRNQETNLGNLSADALLKAARAQVPGVVGAFRNGGAIRDAIGTISKDGVTSGKDVTVLDVMSALRFDSPVVVVDVSHAELARTIEASLIGAGTGQGRFPHVSADVLLRYRQTGADQEQKIVDGRVDGVVKDGTRLYDLRLTNEDGTVVTVVDKGVVVTPDAVVRIATIDYLAKGGDGWFPATKPTMIGTNTAEQRAFRDILADPISVAASLAATGRVVAIP